MDCSVEEVGDLRRKLVLRVAPDELAAREDELMGRYADRINLKGFRPGRVPRPVLRKRFGRQVRREAVEALIREGLQQGVKEHELRPLGPFEVEDSKTDDGIEHRVVFDVHPAIQLPAPADLSLTANDRAVEDREVEDYLADLRLRAGGLEELGADGTIRADDIITLTGEVAVDGERVREIHDLRHMVGAYPFLGKSAEEMTELCAEASPGAELAFATVLPEDFRPETAAGKEAQVALRIQTAQRRIPAEITPTFLNQMGAADEDELRVKIREVIDQRKQQENDRRQQEELMNLLLERCSFPLPEHFLTRIVEQQQRVDERLAKARAGDGEPEAVDADEVRRRVEDELRRSLLMEAVAVQMAVQVTEQDVDQQVALAAHRSGRSVDEMAKELERSGRLADVAQEIRHAKAIGAFLDRVRAEGSVRPADGDTAAGSEEAPDDPAAPKATAGSGKRKTAGTKSKRKKTAKKKTTGKSDAVEDG